MVTISTTATTSLSDRVNSTRLVGNLPSLLAMSLRSAQQTCNRAGIDSPWSNRRISGILLKCVSQPPGRPRHSEDRLTRTWDHLADRGEDSEGEVDVRGWQGPSARFSQDRLGDRQRNRAWHRLAE